MLNAVTHLVMTTLDLLELHNISIFWLIYVGTVSTYTFMGVNIDRMVAITKPLKTFGQTKLWIAGIISLCWVLALIPSLPYLVDTTVARCMKYCSACFIAADNVCYNVTRWSDMSTIEVIMLEMVVMVA